ncbi:MAG: hypothetical protein ACO3OV_06205 [Steroidobacteraceae bacterium]
MARLFIVAFVAAASGYAVGYVRGNPVVVTIDVSETAVQEREARNEKLLQFMIAEGRCPPVDAYCPAVRMK